MPTLIADELRERLTGEGVLRNESSCGSLTQRDAEIGGATAGGQHDRGRVVSARELLRHLETREVGEEDVEHDDRRAELTGRLDRGRAVPRLADDHEARPFEQPPREPPEGGVVVDQQHRPPHVRIVSQCASLLVLDFPDLRMVQDRPDDRREPASYVRLRPRPRRSR
jgi:hypothetical protein